MTNINSLLSEESSDDLYADKEDAAPDKEMPDKEISEESKEIDSIVIPASQHERAEEVTSKLLELQKKHKEISDRV